MSTFKINLETWDGGYRPDASLELPAGSRQPMLWNQFSKNPTSFGVVATTSYKVFSGHCLDIQTELLGTGYHYYTLDVDENWGKYASAKKGFTAEVQLKMITSDSDSGADFYFHDNIYLGQLRFTTTNITDTYTGLTYPYGLTDDFHIIRVTREDTNIKVYADDVLVINGTASDLTTVKPILIFGEVSSVTSRNGHSQWGYFKYTTEGAFPPNTEKNAGWTIKTFDISDKRSVPSHRVIRSKNIITPVNSLDATSIKLGGSVMGSDWESYRTAVRSIKQILNAGEINVLTDDARKMIAINSRFSLKQKTQTFGDFKTTLISKYPYWQEEWASYVSTVPVDAKSYMITNTGDIEVPCRVILTGAAAATVDNDVQIQNETADQLGKYVGVLNPTSELFIDKGFKTYNDYILDIDGVSSFGSYEGDLFTLLPGPNIFKFDGGVAGTMEWYWREAFLL